MDVGGFEKTRRIDKLPGTWDQSILRYPPHVSVYSNVITVEPLIKNPPRKGQPLYKGHFQYPQECICNTFQPPKRGQPPYKGQSCWSESVLYSEVPL